MQMKPVQNSYTCILETNRVYGYKAYFEFFSSRSWPFYAQVSRKKISQAYFCWRIYSVDLSNIDSPAHHNQSARHLPQFSNPLTIYITRQANLIYNKSKQFMKPNKPLDYNIMQDLYYHLRYTCVCVRVCVCVRGPCFIFVAAAQLQLQFNAVLLQHINSEPGTLQFCLNIFFPFTGTSLLRHTLDSTQQPPAASHQPPACVRAYLRKGRDLLCA